MDKDNKEFNEFDEFLRGESLAFERENSLLNNSMIEIESTDQGKIELDGKRYTKVSTRLQILRKNLGFNVRIKTDLLHIDEKLVVAKAEISIFREGAWFEVATGHAEEKRDLSEINKFSAVENAETSAIGRALAALGLSGDEYASIEEIIFAKKRKEATDGTPVELNKEPDSKGTKASPSLINFLLKLLKETNTEIDKFLSYYNVKSIKDLTTSQAEGGLHLLKKKKKTVNQQKAIDQSKKEKQDEALSILKENEDKENESKVTVFRKVSVDNETEEMVEKPLPNIEDDILIDDEVNQKDAEETKVSNEKPTEKSEKDGEEVKSEPVEQDSKEVETETEAKKEVESESKAEMKEEEVSVSKADKKAADEKKDKALDDKSDPKEKTKAKAITKKETKKKESSPSKKPLKGKSSKKKVEKEDDEPKERVARDNDLNNDDDIIL